MTLLAHMQLQTLSNYSRSTWQCHSTDALQQEGEGLLAESEHAAPPSVLQCLLSELGKAHKKLPYIDVFACILPALEPYAFHPVCPHESKFTFHCTTIQTAFISRCSVNICL